MIRPMRFTTHPLATITAAELHPGDTWTIEGDPSPHRHTVDAFEATTPGHVCVDGITLHDDQPVDVWGVGKCRHIATIWHQWDGTLRWSCLCGTAGIAPTDTLARQISSGHVAVERFAEVAS